MKWAVANMTGQVAATPAQLQAVKELYDALTSWQAENAKKGTK
jgi:hypothetical protein